MPAGHVDSVNVGRAVDAEWAGPLKRTAIDKRPVSGRVLVTDDGVEGDEQVDTDHGGIYYPAYLYAREDLDWWEQQLGRELRNGMLGENFTLRDVNVNEMILGQYWRLGWARFQVMGPRIPSEVFAAWMNDPHWIRRFCEAGRPGAYLRPVTHETPGNVAAGDEALAVWTPENGITIAQSWRACMGDTEMLQRILELPNHSPAWDALAEYMLGGVPVE